MVLDEACDTNCTLRNNKTIRGIVKDITECHARLRGLFNITVTPFKAVSDIVFRGGGLALR